MNDYKSRYLGIYEELRNAPNDPKADEIDEPDSQYNFELELITQDDVTVDYILALLAKYVANKSDDKVEDRAKIDNIVNSTMSLRPKKELIDKFIDESEESMMAEDEVASAFRAFCTKERDAALVEIITAERLDTDRTVKFMNTAFRTNNFKTAGTAIAKLLPPVDLFGDDDCDEVKNNVVDKLSTLFNRYSGLY
jgi:type I restriction enzyme R subunit